MNRLATKSILCWVTVAILFALSLGSLLLSGCKPDEPTEEQASITMETGMKIFSGRIQFWVPAGAQVIRRQERLNDTLLSWRALPPGGLQTLRHEVRQDLRNRLEFREDPDEGLPFEERELAGAWVALYYDIPGFYELVSLRGYRPLEQHVLVMEGEADKGREDLILSGMEKMSSTIRKYAEDKPLIEETPFCLDSAVVFVPYSGLLETTSLRISLPSGAVLDIVTESNADEIEQSLGAGLETTIGRLIDEGFDPVIERHKPHNGRVFNGEELVVRDKPTGVLVYKWRHLGSANSGSDPLIDLQLQVKHTDNSLEGIWNQIITSIVPAGSYREGTGTELIYKKQ